MTKAQRQHAREQRALLTLRRTAVRYSLLADRAEDLSFAFADLNAAADKYREAIGERAARKLAGRDVVRELDRSRIVETTAPRFVP